MSTLIVKATTEIITIEEAIRNNVTINLDPNMDAETFKRYYEMIETIKLDIQKEENEMKANTIIEEGAVVVTMNETTKEESTMNTTTVKETTVENTTIEEGATMNTNINREVLQEVIAQQAKGIVDESQVQEVIEVIEEHGTEAQKQAMGSAVESGDLDKIKKAGMVALSTIAAKSKEQAPKLRDAAKGLFKTFTGGMNKLIGTLASVGTKVVKMVLGAIKWIWNSAYALVKGVVMFTVDVVQAIGRGAAHVGASAVESAQTRYAEVTAK